METNPVLWPETQTTETTPSPKPKLQTYRWNEARPCPGRTKDANGRRLRQLEGLGVFVAETTTERPVRHDRRRAWALVPRAVRATAPASRPSWLPARTRRVFDGRIRARNAVDRELAVSKGLAPDSPSCARFQGPEYHDRLDAEVSRRRRAARKAAKP